MTEDAYIQKVRNGQGLMPRFAEDFLSDADLRADFAALTRAPDPSSSNVAALTDPAQWSPEEVETAYVNGLAVWRKPGGVDGMACTNCHSPDGLDLALIGYPDDAILRRAHKHLLPVDTLVVRDFIPIRKTPGLAGETDSV